MLRRSCHLFKNKNTSLSTKKKSSSKSSPTSTKNHMSQQYAKKYHNNDNDDTSSVAIHWFRKGLRLHDNPALLDALKSSSVVLPLFIIDPHFANPNYVGVNRYRFLLEALADLDHSLRSETKNSSRLLVARGNPVDVLPRLCEQWKVNKVTWESDTEPYAVERDAKLREHLEKKLEINVSTFVSHTLYDPEAVRELNPNGPNGLPTTNYSSFCSLVGRLGNPAQPANTRQEVFDLIVKQKDKKKKSSWLQNLLVSKNNKDVVIDVDDDSSLDQDPFYVPTLKEMKYPVPENESKFPGGETHALSRMDSKVSKRAAWVRNFSKPETKPNSLEPDTTVLSPYLKFGCLSPRLFFHELLKIEKGGQHTQPPTSLKGQMLWREFNYYSSYMTPNYHSMKGNPNCRDIKWSNDPELLKAWKEARTGFPFIDAIMTQLRQEGWIHHLARHAVACFLTRGDLWQSWEEGAKVFDELLLDADYALNTSNWLWLSASCFFYQYFRCYSPIEFGKKTDKKGDYIRKYLPQLKKFSDKFIYEPWKAPLTAQHAAGCVIGKDYPKPIVDHATVSKENMNRMSAAYDNWKATGGAEAKFKKVQSTTKKSGTRRQREDDEE